MSLIRWILPAMAICVAVLGCKQREQGTVAPEVVTTASGIEMVRIEGGWFEMGSDTGADDEKPVHRVWVDSFLMDRTEVTQDSFRKMQLPDPSHFKNPDGPVDQANWTDGAIFCNERSYEEGLEPCYDEDTWQCNYDANGYRLPTEAEWEYACRAEGKKYGFGDNERMLGDYAWFSANAGGKTHSVAQKKPNELGLFDMHGNVMEWCGDYYAADYYAAGEERNPRGPAQGKERVLRGGAWNSSPDACRAAYRTSDPSIDDTCLANDAIGFRCVRRVDSSETATKE